MRKIIKIFYYCFIAGFISVNLIMNFFIFYALLFLDYKAVYIYEHNSFLLFTEFILLSLVIPLFFYLIKKQIDNVIED